MIGDDGDIGIIPFPTISDTFKGAEGSADSFMVLNDRPEVRAFAEFLATPEGLEGWIKGVGVLTRRTSRCRPSGTPATTS